MNENFIKRHVELRNFKIKQFWFLQGSNKEGKSQYIVFDSDFEANFEKAKEDGFQPKMISVLKNGFYISGFDYDYQEKLEKFNRKRKKTTFVEFLKQDIFLEVL